ncbi:hypothetical protein K7X08_006903 [Anisodus acutangulus]|uniref:very-long-chain 3-oxoacyl-CoA synthase n=1 Tax=Anisodus acutangulus TaxID=402998 RepID=A0A9Q1LEC8_9SOLA|nr:hypothetical protein K7X08_006903 [Anisodus acutangulus]
MMSKKEFVDIISSTFDEESANLQKKVLERCGYSDKTYVPHSIRMLPAKLLTFNNSRKEIEKVMFGAIDDLLSITRVNAREIGIVIVNIGVHNPTPSLSAMIVNHYKLGSDVLTYNISGMGCSAGLISIDLANRLLQNIFKKPYIPDFKLAFEHFFIHAGGRAVLDEMEKNLELTEWHMEPSRMTLYRFGNTSSSSLWYELAYSEAKGRIKKGDRAWQIGFGSGFKCNSVVWHALKTINPADLEKNPWTDEIQDFPVHVPAMMPLSS